jgi:PAS domain S-box-containing protein
VKGQINYPKSFGLLSFFSAIGLKSVRAKLVVVGMIISGLSILLTCIIAYRSFFSAIDSSGNLKKNSQSMAETVDLLVFENIQFVRGMANDQFIKDKAEASAQTAEKLSINSQPDQQQLEALETQYRQTHTLDDRAWETSEFLREKSHLKGVFDRMFFTDRYGLTVGMTTMTEDFVQSDEQWWKKAFASGLYVSDLAVDKVTGTWSIDVCVAIPHPKTGQPNGVLKVTYNLQDAQDYIARFKEYDSGYAYVINKDGMIVLHPDADKRGKAADEKIRKSGVLEQTTTKASGVLQIDGLNPVSKDREERVISYQQSRGAGNQSFQYTGFGWTYFADNSYNEVYAPANRMLGTIIIAGIILFVLFGGLAFVFADSFAWAIRNLHDTTEQIIEGNLSARTNISTGDELERVSDGFNQMMGRLEAMVKEEVDQKMALMGISKAIESCGDAIFILDLTKDHFFCNKKFTEVFGYTSEQVKHGKGLSLLCSDEQKIQEINQALKFTGSWAGELKLHTATGKELLIALRADSVKDEEGQVVEQIGILTDITERKKAEKELLLSQERFSKVFSFSPLNMSINDKRGAYLDVNDGFLTNTGYSKEELLGKTGVEMGIISKEDSRRINESLKESGAFRNLEISSRRKDGEMRTILYSGVLINIENDSFFLGASTDVTELKRAERETRISQERFSKIFNFSPLSMNINGLRGVYLDVNDFFLDTTGFTREEVQGKTPVELKIITPEDDEKIGQALKANGSFRNLEINFTGKSGDVRTILYSGVIINVDGEKFFMGVSNDITEQKQAERELRITEERFSKTFNFCPLIMSITNLSNDTLIDVNDTFLQVTGYTRDEVINHQTGELNLFTNQDVVRLLDLLKESNSFRNQEVVLQTKSGECRTVLLSAEVFNLGEDRCLLSVATDITERKLLEKQMDDSLAEFFTLASTVSEGDLTGRGKEGEDAVGKVVHLVNKMLDHFSLMLTQVKHIGLSVSSSAIEILAAAEQMAVGAQRQADEITNTSSAVEEMAATMTQVSKNAQASADAARQAFMLAERGGESVRFTVEAMGRINSAVQMTSEKMRSLGQRSYAISEIIDLIDEVAAQTNLLALNAAIEAAHAGQAGVGFSVVAEEIRKLAERSARATKDVDNLIKSIQTETAEALEAMEKGRVEVAEGSLVATQASESLTDISTAVNLSADLIEEISAAADEQARVTRDLSGAMQTISSITIETSAGAHETAQTIQGMVTLSEQLNEAISKFRVVGEHEGSYPFEFPPPASGNLGGGFRTTRYNG